MAQFNYIVDKISSAPILETPFRHIYIEDLFSPNHFKQITEDPSINLPALGDDNSLVNKLRELNYQPIPFPGCTTNEKQYLKWHRNRKRGFDNVNTCEGFGVAYRLKNADNPLIHDLINFFKSELLFAAMADRFSIDIERTTKDSGLQKYLDGYEISPHPDIRKKALTYMVNINPGKLTETLDIHTHYLKFKKNKEYIYSYWKNNPTMDRSWVPWDWCETSKIQSANNSIVIFSPGDDTIHAVKARYNHLKQQRTQLYGNLWYKDSAIESKPCWEDLEVKSTREKRTLNIASRKFISLKSRVLRKYESLKRKF